MSTANETSQKDPNLLEEALFCIHYLHNAEELFEKEGDYNKWHAYKCILVAINESRVWELHAPIIPDRLKEKFVFQI